MADNTSQDIVSRFKSIHLDLRSRRFELSPVALNEIKPSLISCLTMEGNGVSRRRKVLILGLFCNYSCFVFVAS
ncbi:unnamed protein product [Cochlearia groenlandica]